MRVMIRDLHTHSNASDGSLSPQALVAYAVEHGVDVLSITDHDTVNAYKQQGEIDHGAITIIPGIELSTTWNDHSIHVVGLNIDPHNPVLRAGIEKQQQARQERAETIAARLTRLGIDNPFEAVKLLAGDASIGRPHFARHLVNIGKVRDVQTAFRKYLGAGKAGDVKQGWASMPDVNEWIRAAGGVPVLAHPAKYKFTNTKLRVMLEDFRESGGMAVEVVCGRQEPTVTRKIASIALDLELLGSTGSDFHHIDNKWSRPGGFPELPDGIEAVWDAW
jgi:predicted metal-dependent phosphoesterase TrpH